MKKIINSFIMFIALIMAVPCFGANTMTTGDQTFSGHKTWEHDATFKKNVIIEGQIIGQNATGDVFYVQSARGSDSTGNFGTTFDKPFATVDYAINQCTANHGDVIYVLPGHAESYSAANGFDADVAGVSIIGIGSGQDMPEFTFADTDATVAVGAASVTFENLRFLAGISEVVTGISVEAGGDDFTMINCEFPEPTTSTFEFDISIILASGADSFTMYGVTAFSEDATGATSFLDMSTGVNNNVKILNSYIIGEYSNAPIYSNKADLEVLIKNCEISNTTNGEYAIEFTTTATGQIVNTNVRTDAQATSVDPGSLDIFNVLWCGDTAADTACIPAIALSDGTTNFIGANNNNNSADTSTVTANADGSILERLEQIDTDTSIIVADTPYIADLALPVSPVANSMAAYLASGGTALGTELADSKSIIDALGSDGTTLADTASGIIGVIGVPTDANNVVDSSTIVGNANGSVYERLEAIQLAAFGPAYSHPNYLAVSTGTFDTTGTWSTAASHEVATVTGAVKMIILPEIKSTVASVGDNGTLSLGDETTATSLIAATTMGSGLGAAGEWWVDNSLDDTLVVGSKIDALTFAVGNGKDIGYTVGTNAMSGGSITFHIWWIPLDAAGAVAAGAGGTL